MLLNRKELNHLNDWFTNKNRKPLVIRGARQVGKSTLVRMLANKRKLELVELNFERNPESEMPSLQMIQAKYLRCLNY